MDDDLSDLSFQELVNEALKNAREDRERAKEAYENMKEIFNIDSSDPSTLQAVMLVGAQAVKLIETIASSNDQVLKAAALKQKDKTKNDDLLKSGPMDIDELRRQVKDGTG